MSNLRSRRILAARKRQSARRSAGTRFQESNALLAASTAWAAISGVAVWKTPITCDGCEGLVEVRFSAVITFWPPLYMGYSRPNSEATFFRASSMALRFSGFEESIKGSFVNSETWIFASAVAMAAFLLNKQTSDCTAGTDGLQDGWEIRQGTENRLKPVPQPPTPGVFCESGK